MDDITAVVVFLDPSMAYTTQKSNHFRQKSNSLPAALLNNDNVADAVSTPSQTSQRIFTEV